MLIGKIVLGVSSLAFIGFGIICLFSPEVPAELIGLQINSGDAFVEVGAVYGGLQTALGLFLLVALLNRAYYRAGLLLLVLCMGCLALARLIAMLMTTDLIGSYTYSALGFEAVIAIMASFAYWTKNNDPT